MKRTTSTVLVALAASELAGVTIVAAVQSPLSIPAVSAAFVGGTALVISISRACGAAFTEGCRDAVSPAHWRAKSHRPPLPRERPEVTERPPTEAAEPYRPTAAADAPPVAPVLSLGETQEFQAVLDEPEPRRAVAATREFAPVGAAVEDGLPSHWWPPVSETAVAH